MPKSVKAIGIKPALLIALGGSGVLAVEGSSSCSINRNTVAAITIISNVSHRFLFIPSNTISYHQMLFDAHSITYYMFRVAPTCRFYVYCP